MAQVLNEKDCPYCKGTGIEDSSEYLSQCCGAENTRSDDYDICPDCGEHSSFGIECEYCNGSGINCVEKKEDKK